jgi:hypothetical protein
LGVGVEPARGFYRTDAPKLESGQVASFINTAGTDLVHGVEHMVEEVAKGQIVPTIMTWLRKEPDVAEQSAAQSPA